MDRITCPWCGTNYLTFQSNCDNCGGPLPLPGGTDGEDRLTEASLLPPPPPRPIASRYAWRLLTADGLAVVAFVFVVLGAIFTLVGVGLTLGVITAVIGIPFMLLGLLFLGAGTAVGVWRYRAAQNIVMVLQTGDAAEGQIARIDENFNVNVNGRHPWVIRYQFRVNGEEFNGQVSTYNTPGAALQPGQRACVLFLPQSPKRNVLYPHP